MLVFIYYLIFSYKSSFTLHRESLEILKSNVGVAKFSIKDDSLLFFPGCCILFN